MTHIFDDQEANDDVHYMNESLKSRDDTKCSRKGHSVFCGSFNPPRFAMNPLKLSCKEIEISDTPCEKRHFKNI